MLQIWGRTNSSNVKKVLWCAEEIGLPYNRIDAGGQFGGVDTPDYLAMNPNGLIPTIKDGDLILWESHTIVRYLAAKHEATTLYPTELGSRAQAEKWMDWVSAALMEPFRDLFWNVVRLAPEQRNADVAKKGFDGTSRLLGIANAQLANTRFLAGNELTVADIPLGCIAYAWFNMPIDRPELPHLHAWYDQLAARPSFQKAVMVPLT